MNDRDDTPVDRKPPRMEPAAGTTLLTVEDVERAVARVLAAKASVERDVAFAALPEKKQRRLRGTNKPVDPREDPKLATAGAVRSKMNARAKGEPTGKVLIGGVNVEWQDTPSGTKTNYLVGKGSWRAAGKIALVVFSFVTGGTIGRLLWMIFGGGK